MKKNQHTYIQPMSELMYDRIRLVLHEELSVQDLAKAIAYIVNDEFEGIDNQNEFIKILLKNLEQQ
jgi:hypothetical protein